MNAYDYVSRFGHSSASVGIAAVSLGLQVGTGGAPTFEYHKSRGNRGYAHIYLIQNISEYHDVIVNRNPIENLTRIRTIIKSSITELAAIFKVSRQAVYNWQNGTNQPETEHQALLGELANAADQFVKYNIIDIKKMINRKIVGGKNFIEIVKNGESVESAANCLIQLAQKEDEQRRKLTDRLKHRTKPEFDFGEMGISQFSEEA